MKHFLIILSLGIIGAGLYWVATTKDVAPSLPTPAITDAPEAPQPGDPDQEASSSQAANEQTKNSPKESATAEPSVTSETTEQPSQLKRYGNVLQELEQAEVSKAPAMPRSVSTTSSQAPNRALESYEATLRTINE